MNTTCYLPDREEDTFQRHCRLSKILTNSHIHVFDVGANVGQSIRRYRDYFPNCFITSFEPNPEPFNQLEADWGDVSGITLNQIALSNQIGHSQFFSTRVTEASSLLEPADRIVKLSSEHKYDYKIIDVKTLTLDHYCQLNNIHKIDILKLDTQGFELNILKGAEFLLQEQKITIVYTEITFAETYKNQTLFVELVSYLNQFNYDIWDIGSFLYTRNERLWAANLIFLHSSAGAFIEK